jgi:O-acetyl-ADP-ribose deacetylase (regulator of RNase III)
MQQNKEIATKNFHFVEKIAFSILETKPGKFLQVLENIQKSLQVIFTFKQNNVVIYGQKESIEQAEKELAQLEADIMASLRKDTVDIPAYLSNELATNQMLKKEILEKTGMFLFFPESEVNPVVLEIALKDSQTKIQIVNGDITKENTECIVNCANEFLKHDGGIAHQIAKKGGKVLISECEQIIKRVGSIAPGNCVRTSAGDLKCLSVLHVVGPRWHGGHMNEEGLLRLAVKNCIRSCEEVGYRSISIPLISSGIFGYPPPLAAKVLVQEMLLALKMYPKVKQVRLCDLNAENAVLLCKELRDQLGAEQRESERELMRSIKPIGVQWYWQESDGSFVPFDADQNRQIETAYLTRQPGEKIIVTGDREKQRNSHHYEIDFDKMTELNTKYRRTYRKIKRESIGGPTDDDFQSYLNKRLTSSTDSLPTISMPLNQTKKLTMVGLGEDFFTRKDELLAAIKKLECQSSAEAPGPLSNEQCNHIFSIGLAHRVEVHLDPKSSAMILKGLDRSVMSAKSEILSYLMKSMPKVKLPEEWTPQTTNCELVTLNASSAEFKSVVARLQETLPHVQVYSIDRIQNKWLWEKYLQQKELLIKKNGGIAKEEMLFHGTKSNDPKLIYDGETGFDMRLAASGMWGTATYFAYNASYSDRYAFKDAKGQRVMLLSTVLIGDSVFLTSNPALKKPPQKGKNKMGFLEDYDSVTGEASGSRVFMVYENNRAYPKYLITYTTK